MEDLEQYEKELDLLVEAVEQNHDAVEIAERASELSRMGEILVPTLSKDKKIEHLKKIDWAMKIMHERHGGTIH